ncbi:MULTISPECIES: polynucleotide kinase-phosphatase [Fischerella]|uniref:Polynucleotide kinase-phosphatase n=1 Tax=Fischerella muscicola CCMEE 5323 TaxID=2019572 RepID=A0A2N6K5S1_FISMU|nr:MULTISPECIES: polynucleotide kinase-phosphatase [Fischerella]MBD2430989.1 polynucleotide kinase-phosphatase [Fischerella sp. FACHB-380]PLZ92033.1 polynucleotide kinase-phosphatase [Fischerella muscicola CCMEE 5323]
MKLTIPELSLVVLIGASGAGKSTFARRLFQPFEVLSSDFCRGLVSDDENNQFATKDAFDVLHFITTKRLAAGKLTVIDATNVQPEDRKIFVQLARKYHFFPVAIALNLPEEVCHQRNQQRPNRQFGSHVVRRQIQMLRRSLRGLEREGFRYVYILNSVAEIDTVKIERQPLWNNRKYEHGPFDIIGDIHGCCDELEALLEKLGYVKGGRLGGQGGEIASSSSPTPPTPRTSPLPPNPTKWEPLAPHLPTPTLWDAPTYYHPQGRKAVFLGDLVDRGPRILDTVKLVRNMVVAGTAICVPGNHENKFLRKLRGKNVKVNHGLEKTLAEIEALPAEWRENHTKELKEFLDTLVSHYVLDDGRLVVAHAGMKEEYQGRGSAQVREFALYGETTGEIDEFGLPIRYNWAAEYRGQAMVVYGHTPVLSAEWLNNTINIDTGCVFGGKLTALRYPEKELVSVPAAHAYSQPAKPIDKVVTEAMTFQQQLDDVLNIDDVLGNRIINTRLVPNIKIREENAIAALEVISRFAANPKWLIYLPPTMSPVETSQQLGYLEHPEQAFAYYRHRGITQVICEEKHMDSRAVVIVCRDETAAKKRFGIVNEGIGICYTRTGRRFFDHSTLETELLDRLNTCLTNSGFWENFHTDWVCLDCELMPLSAKAQGLLREQYAPVGVASRLALGEAVTLLERAQQRGIDVTVQLSNYQQKAEMTEKYVTAYRRYCWPVEHISDYKLAPFHILATETAVHTDKDHQWHMQEVAKIALHDPDLLLPTAYKVIDLTDPSSEAEGVHWWEELTAMGGEGIVVKPMQFIVKSSRGIIQPAVKCRGQEYLRMIYGLEYSAPENMQRLRQRGLTLKCSLAKREFALGVEALERFITHAPLRRVHECIVGILALESEPVDPRL